MRGYVVTVLPANDAPLVTHTARSFPEMVRLGIAAAIVAPDALVFGSNDERMPEDDRGRPCGDGLTRDERRIFRAAIAGAR